MLNPAALLKFCMYAPELWRDWGNGWDAKAKRHWTSPVESHCSSTPRTGRREFVSCAFTVWHFYIRWIILVETLGKGDNSKIYWRKHFKNEWAWASVIKKLVEKKSGETNLWDKMTKSKFLSWNSSGEDTKPQAKSRNQRSYVQTAHHCTIIPWAWHGSSHCKLRFPTTNRTLMQLNGSAHPATLNKSSIISIL